MCRSKDKKWWKAHDLINAGVGTDLFAGYEAGPRLSELTKDNPLMFSTKIDGKYHLRSLNFDTVSLWFDTIPKDLKQVIAKELDYYPQTPEIVRKEQHEKTTSQNQSLFTDPTAFKKRPERINGFDFNRQNDGR